MDPEHTRLGTDVDDFWDDDDTSTDYTPRQRAHPNTVAPREPVASPTPSQLDTNWWDDDTRDAHWDAATAPQPAHDPVRGHELGAIGVWSPTLEHRPSWYRTRAAAIALIAAAAAAGLTALVLALRSPAADDQNTPPATPHTRPSATSVAPTPSTTAPPPAIAPPPPPVPPPPAEQISPPAGGGGYTQWPRNTPPPQTDKPRIDVTRAPISVAPEPRTPPKTATPGSSGGGGWRW